MSFRLRSTTGISAYDTAGDASTHLNDITIVVSASLDDFNDFDIIYFDVERSRNVHVQDLVSV